MDFSAIAAVAARQDSVLGLEDFRTHGVSGRTVRGWVAQGRLLRPHVGVFTIAGAPLTFCGRLRAAVLAAGEGATVSHRAAAVLWGLLDAGPVEISVPYRRRASLGGVVVHRSGDLEGERIRQRHNLPVTDPMRTVIDCGAVMPDAEVADVLETALAVRLFPIAGIERAHARLSRPGRHGCGVLRRVLDTRALAAEVPESLLEVRMANLLASSGLPAAVFQHPVAVNGSSYRIDFAYPELLIAIEVDGWRKFSSPAKAAQVLQRQNALAASGWTVLRFMWADVVRRPHDVAAQIADARALRSL